MFLVAYLLKCTKHIEANKTEKAYCKPVELVKTKIGRTIAVTVGTAGTAVAVAAGRTVATTATAPAPGNGRGAPAATTTDQRDQGDSGKLRTTESEILAWRNWQLASRTPQSETECRALTPF